MTRAVLFDLSGVLYVGGEALPGAVAALQRVRDAGLATCFVTNVSQQPRQTLLAELRRMGLPIDTDALLTAPDAAAMAEGCERAGVVFMEAFMYRLHPSWRAVVGMVHDGRIGELRAVQARFSYFNDDPANIRNQAAIGGGALMDIGCYPINVARMLFASEPDRVEAAIFRDPRFGTDVLTSAILEFGAGHASFTVSTLAAPDQRVTVTGSTGLIEVEIPFNIPPDRPARILVTIGDDAPATVEFPVADQYTIEASEFARAVLDGAPVPTPPDDGVANMVVIERILAAAGG